MNTIDIDYLLQKEFPYYRKLSTDNQTLFKDRIKEFVKYTEFEGRKGLDITETKKILVAATAAQLTLGFNSYYNYDHFKKIILYPERYLSSYTGQMHTGEMNTGGVIVFSWKDFYEGIKTDNDSRNVGLHEFAHALDFIDKAELGINDYFAHAIDKIKVYGRHYIHKQPEKPFFRSYAATNSAEFFAVGTEYFFEAPIEFRKEMPELYNLYCIAYRQQPQPKIEIPTKTLLRDTNIAGTSGKYSSAQIVSALGWSIMIMAQIVRWLVIPSIPALGDVTNNGSVIFGYLFTMLISLGLIFNLTFKGSLGFYEHKVRVYYPLWKVLGKLLFYRKDAFHRDISIENVLLIHTEENQNRNNELDYKITCTYLYENRLKHSSWRVSSIRDLNKPFSYYYNEHKIAFREDGAIKKYELK